MENRETFRSRIGFLLVSAGCAIGIGNVWKFPYVAGQNGGGLFVLFYLVFLALLGIPVLTMELSIGAASMVVFGSYMSKDDALPGEAVKIGALDTFVAIVSGLIIIPACFSFGIEPDEGPSLIFVTLPCVFADMNGGRIWGALFFLFMTFASFSTVTAVFETLVGSLMDNFNISRVKSVLINAVAILVLSIPCVLGFNLWSEIRILGMGILEFEDFLVSNLLLPIGSLVFVFFSVYNFGWGADNFLTEANTGKGLKFGKALIPYFRFVLPVLILVIIITGLFF